jgi:CRP-like cAMP-binding protein
MKIGGKRPSRFIFDLPKEWLPQMVSIHKKKGDTLYQRGDVSKGLYYIESGLVALTNISDNGQEIMLRVLGNKYWVGNRSFIAEEKYHATAVILKDTHLLFLPLKNIQELLEKYPTLLCHLAQKMSWELRISEERFYDMACREAQGRIIEAFIYLKTRHPDYLWTRREIAEFTGSTIETVTRIFSSLEKEGFLKKEGRDIQIIDEDSLLEYIGHDFFEDN